MFINNVHRKEEIQNIAIQHLRKYGIKYRPKKQRPPQQVTRYGKKFFKVPLQNLETETVTLTNGQQLVIPKRIHEMCSYILSKVQTEGLFRKEGSKSRQNEIKLSLDRGCLLGHEHHVIDVAVVLKSFLRELPEPLIPQTYHELFLRCSIGENRLDAILLACLLLPGEHLNVLSYLMQFFYEVASFSTYNKMNFSNLSILVGPNIFPIDEKIVPKSSLMITKICDITKLLIENSKNIGVIPDNIIEQIGQLSDNETEKRRKNKRRSGSLTRMLSGLKKIVGSKTVEESCSSQLVTPDLLSTPTIHNVVKKRKAECGLSLKKRKEVVAKLPDCALLNTPFTPCRTPVSIHPGGQRNMEKEDCVTEITKEKKMHWYMRSRSMKSLKEDESTTSSSSRRSSFGPRSLLERRWSAVSSAANFRKKKRNSCAATKKEHIIAERKQAMKQQERDYVRVPKSEYEEFKSRVSAIERRISLELDNVQSHIDNDNDNNVNREIANERDGNIESVQEAYKKTLESSSLSPTTDQLARRLSRDLRIRRSAEQKIIRSPSARKIGTLRRRSTEREKKNARVVRNQSWHLGTSTVNSTAPLIPRISMRRNKYTINDKENSKETPPMEILQSPANSTSLPKSSGGRKTRNSLSRMQSSPYTFSVDTSFVNHKSPQQAYSVNLSESGLSYVTTSSNTSNDHWMSAEGFFSAAKTPQDGSAGNARASIAKLRSQNIGMVRAKARLFDNMKESDTSCDSLILSKSQSGSGQKGLTRTVCKNGSGRTAESTRMSYRVRTLRLEEKKAKKASISPRRRQASVSHRQRLQNIGKQYVRGSRENSSAEVSQESIELTTPRKDLNSLENALSPKKSATLHNAPHIKMPLIVRTPKRLCRTPGVNRRTPFKVVATPL